MTANLIGFIVLAVASTLSAIGVIAFKDAVHSALSLILTLLFVALFYFLLDSMFIGIVQILIYAGAIMVLFLFVVTMLAPDQDMNAQVDHIPWQKAAAAALGLLLVGALSFLIFTDANITGPRATAAESLSAQIHKVSDGQGFVEAFGQALFHGYLFPFEVTSLLIVVAILGALVFGRRA